LAKLHSAIKRIRSNERKRQRNQVHRSRARSLVKQSRRLITTGKLEQAEGSVLQAIRALDNAAQKGIIPKNNAARRKSRLMRQLHAAKHEEA
jgi:small subunit ribosomal protein S20